MSGIQLSQGAVLINAAGAQNPALASGAITGVLATLTVVGTTPSTYTWQYAAPAGSISTLSSTSASGPTFTPDIAGLYDITLTDQASVVYTLQLQIAKVASTNYPGPVNHPYVTPAQVATPGVGITTFSDSTNGGAFSQKDSTGTVSVVASTATASQINSVRVPWKGTVRLVATSVSTGSGQAAIDGVSPSVGDRVLRTADGVNNGIWVVAAGAWSRATDMASSADCIPGSRVSVSEGTGFVNSLWYLANSAPITLGATSLNFQLNEGKLNVRRYGAKGDGTTDDAAAFTSAVTAAIAANIGVIEVPAGMYAIGSQITIPQAVAFVGIGHATGGTGDTTVKFPTIIKTFNGSLFKFTGAAGTVPTSGGGLERLRIVNSFSIATNTGAGYAIDISAVDAAHTPSWLKFRHLIIEEKTGLYPWTYCIKWDGTNNAGTGIPDCLMEDISTHCTADVGVGGGMLVKAAKNLFVINCSFYQNGDISVTGDGTTSTLAPLFNNVSAGTLKLDYVANMTWIGGALTAVTNTANGTGTSSVVGARLSNDFSDSAPTNNSLGVLWYSATPYSVGVNGGFKSSKQLVLPIGQYIIGQGSAGGTSHKLIGPKSDDTVWVDPDGLGTTFGASITVATYPQRAYVPGSPGTSTPNVAGINYMHIANTGVTTITNFTGGVTGQLLVLTFADSNTTVNRSNCALAGSANFVSTNLSTLTLIKGAGGLWQEINRVTNNG